MSAVSSEEAGGVPRPPIYREGGGTPSASSKVKPPKNIYIYIYIYNRVSTYQLALHGAVELEFFSVPRYIGGQSAVIRVELLVKGAFDHVVVRHAQLPPLAVVEGCARLRRCRVACFRNTTDPFRIWGGNVRTAARASPTPSKLVVGPDTPSVLACIRLARLG